MDNCVLGKMHQLPLVTLGQLSLLSLNYETGPQINTKFGTGVERLLFPCAKFEDDWAKLNYAFKKNTTLLLHNIMPCCQQKKNVKFYIAKDIILTTLMLSAPIAAVKMVFSIPSSTHYLSQSDSTLGKIAKADNCFMFG